MPRPKKGDPELLLVSFCDIVTITTAAMFLAMIIVIDKASKIPTIRPLPLSRVTTNSPIYFECRAGYIFPVERDELMAIFKDAGKKAALASMTHDDVSKSLDYIDKLDVGNKYYKMDTSYMLTGIMALYPREGSVGTSIEQILQSPSNDFRRAVEAMDPSSQYIAFLVRDDAFEVFRRARDLATTRHIFSGWEFLEAKEPITFSGGKLSIQ